MAKQERSAKQRRSGNDWLSANGGWILIAAGVALIVLAACYSTRVPVATVFAFTGIASIVFGVLLPRIEGAAEFSTTGIKMVINGLHETLAMEGRTPEAIANIYEMGFDQLRALVSPASVEPSGPTTPAEEEEAFSPGLTRDIPAPTPLGSLKASRVADWLRGEGWEVEENPRSESGAEWDFLARRGDRVLMVELRTQRTGAANIAAAALTLDHLDLDVPQAVMVVPAGQMSEYARDQARAVADTLTVYLYYPNGNFVPIGARDPVREQ